MTTTIHHGPASIHITKRSTTRSSRSTTRSSRSSRRRRRSRRSRRRGIYRILVLVLVICGGDDGIDESIPRRGVGTVPGRKRSPFLFEPPVRLPSQIRLRYHRGVPKRHETHPILVDVDVDVDIIHQTPLIDYYGMRHRLLTIMTITIPIPNTETDAETETETDTSAAPAAAEEGFEIGQGLV